MMPRSLPVRVVANGPRLGGVERFVRVELVDDEKRALLGTALGAELVIQPRGRRGHRPGSGELGFVEEPGPAVVVSTRERRRTRRQRGCTHPRRIRSRAPGIVLVTAQVVPRREVVVVVLAARLEQVRMVGHEHRGDTRVATEQPRDGVFPDLDRAPRPPGKIERTDEQIVTRRHAGQRPRHVIREAHRTGCEPVEVRRVELRAAITAEHVPVEAVEQHDHHVAGHHSVIIALIRPPRIRTGGGTLRSCRAGGTCSRSRLIRTSPNPAIATSRASIHDFAIAHRRRSPTRRWVR